MRILLVTPAFWPQVGGAERLLLELARGLTANGAEVRVVTPTPGSEDGEPFEIRRLPHRYTFYRQDTVMPWALAQQVREFRPDVLQTSGPCISEPLAIPIFTSLRLPAVSLYHGGFNEEIALARAYGAAHVLALRAFSRIVTTNERIAGSLRAQGLAESRVATITPGISSSFKPAGAGAREPFLLFVGALDENHRYKRVDLLLQAAALVFRARPELRLAIVGRGGLAESYRRLAVELGIAARVDFRDDVDDAELGALYGRAGAFVLASATIQEGFGLVVLEAMANGCPAVVSAAAGCAAFVRAAGGVVVAPDDARALAGGILELLDPQRHAQASRSAVAATEPLRWPATARRWLDEVYAPLVG
jgi:glycosyltransferase involved in cell wall biosynthesis